MAAVEILTLAARRSYTALLSDDDADSPLFAWFDRDGDGQLRRRDDVAAASVEGAELRTNVHANEGVETARPRPRRV